MWAVAQGSNRNWDGQAPDFLMVLSKSNGETQKNEEPSCILIGLGEAGGGISTVAIHARTATAC